MNRRSLSRPVGAIALACAVSALMALPPVTVGDVPPERLGELRNAVGEAVSQVAAPPTRPTTPATGSPSRPAPRPSRPAPAVHRPSAPLRGAAPAAAQPVTQAGGVRASSSRASGSSSQAPAANSSPASAGTSGGTQAVDPTDAATVAVAEDAADLGDEGADTLPFTGYRTFPVLLVAVLLLLAGIGVRRAVRPPA